MQSKNQNTDLCPEEERYLELCERAFQRMIDTQKWPWEDEPDFLETEQVGEPPPNQAV